MILLILDNKAIGLELKHNNFDSFLRTGIALAIFSMGGKTPDGKDRLNISAR